MTHHIHRVAVLGAGTMGAAIAAHAANAGLSVDLLDIAPIVAKGKERNSIVKAGFERMLKAKPAALMHESLAEHIRLGNFQDDFERLKEADWILEAIIEQVEPKQELMARIEQVAKAGAIISSNTSGIPLAKVAQGRSEGFKQRFLGTHFFNPPRYLKLLEIIPTADTDPQVLETMRTFGERVLGKGVVIAKDTPNFIANRIGSYSGQQAVRYTLKNGYGIEEVDALTGPLIGRPTTATFRLMDQVGLDIPLGVAQNLYSLIPDDQFREELVPPEPLLRMAKAGLLGLKTGSGFYKRTKRDGQPQQQKAVFKRDEGPRRDTSEEGLAKLRPVFQAGGTFTAGNSSQRSDGAAAVVVMERERAEQLGLKPVLRFAGFAVAGVRPEVMGIGPIVAIPKVLKLTGLSLSDIDLLELNEAFASQSLAIVRELGLDMEKLNVNGGAIALGHPMGATGSKLTIQLMHEMKRRTSRYGMVTMCIGGGMGAAGIFENLQG